MYESLTRASQQSGLAVHEVLGLTPGAPAQAWLALRGDPHLPAARAGLSALRQYRPKLGVVTWLGRRTRARHVIISNLFNHTQTPPEAGWSVAITQVRDFRGGKLTYNSHNGTDFAIPPGTGVRAAAPGVVVAIRSEYNRGGLKLFLDHGGGLLTSSNHLARVLVQVGDVVSRGQLVALSGYSGLDALLSFPFVAPHVHYNVSLGGALVDPFAAGADEVGAPSLWRALPLRPWNPASDPSDAPFAPTVFDPNAVAAVLADLKDPARRGVISAISDPRARAWEVVIESFTYPTRFATLNAGMALLRGCVRRACLDLPFSAADFDGAVFVDELG